VQGFPSSQLRGAPPTQFPAWQASPVVHLLASSQTPGFATYLHPSAASQLSVVQTLPSSQARAGPPTHAPAWQLSAVVHALASSQAPAFGACTQPLAGTQESVVHGFGSEHSNAAPPAHAPAEQASPVVHALPSSQALVFGTLTQPVPGWQLSEVQALLSSHAI